MAVETFDKVVTRDLHIHGGQIQNVHGLQAAAIADASLASGGDAPTEAEFNAVVAKLNALLAAVRSGTGVGIVAAG